MESPSLYIAFLAGLGSFVSPCVLPLLPAFLASIVPSKPGKARLFVNTVGFVLGFGAVFVLLGLSVTALGGFLVRHINTLQKLGGLLVMVLGLHLAGLFRIPYLARTIQGNPLPISGPLRPLALGFIFGLGWTPCVGPILTSILILATSTGDPVSGATLLAAYASGLALPFLIGALFLDRLTKNLRLLGPYLVIAQRLAGVGLVVLGMLLYFGRL